MNEIENLKEKIENDKVKLEELKGELATTKQKVLLAEVIQGGKILPEKMQYVENLLMPEFRELLQDKEIAADLERLRDSTLSALAEIRKEIPTFFYDKDGGGETKTPPPSDFEKLKAELVSARST